MEDEWMCGLIGIIGSEQPDGESASLILMVALSLEEHTERGSEA